MKKFSLIIPQHFKSQFIYRITCTAIFCIVYLKSSADVHDYGCRVGNRIFQNLDVNNPGPTNFQYDSDNNGFPNGFSNVAGRCNDPYSFTSCTLYNYDGTIRATGILSDFSIDYCPIDDYVPLLLICTAAVSGLQIRKKFITQSVIKND